MSARCARRSTSRPTGGRGLFLRPVSPGHGFPETTRAPGYVSCMEAAELAAALLDRPAYAGVGLLVLHGSRARGDAGPGADWDFGYLADSRSGAPTPDPPAVIADLVSVTGTDLVDLVDLATASALLRFRAARDGVALLETRPDAFLDFRLEAVQFWCDAGSVIRAAHDDVLASLP